VRCPIAGLCNQEPRDELLLNDMLMYLREAQEARRQSPNFPDEHRDIMGTENIQMKPENISAWSRKTCIAYSLYATNMCLLGIR
jgi:hypothetical protein